MWENLSHVAAFGTFILTALTVLVANWPRIKEINFMKNHNWRIYANIFAGILLVTGIAITGYSIMNNQTNTTPTCSFTYDHDAQLELVTDRWYQNEKVTLDGYRYRNCTFTNVTFVYNGTKPFEFSYNTVEGPITLTTQNIGLWQYLLFLNAAGIIDHDAVNFHDEPRDY